MIVHTDTVQTLLDELTPDIDAAALSSAAQRYEDLAQRLSELAHILAGAAPALADPLGGGRTSVAVVTRAHDVAGGELGTAVAQVRATADVVRLFAEAVAMTQQRLIVVAAIADRDLLAAQVMVAATGDTTLRAGAEYSAAQVMTAAVGELDWRAGQIADEATDTSGSDQPPQQHSPGMGAPMMPAAMMAPMAAALAGAAAHGAGDNLVFDVDVSAADLAMLQTRAAVLTATQPPEVAPWIRLAVGWGQDGDGRRVVVVGTSEPAGYLRPGVVPEPHEVVVGDGRAPELAIIDHFADRALTPLAVCAATPAPPEVTALVGEAGAATVAVPEDDSATGGGQ